MEPLEGSLYDYPRYYDLVFGSDWKAEFDFLEQCFEHLAQRPVQQVFEPACGTGRLLFRLARAGYRVSGLDINPHAVDYCNQRLRRHGVAGSVFVGDMADFQLAQPVDAAFNMINSFRHLSSQATARGHLECMARAIAPGGLYVLGLHLTPTVGTAVDEESWSARRGHLGVNTHLKTIHRDSRRREERCRMTCNIYTPTRWSRLSEELIFRTYTATQMRRLLHGVPDFEVAAVYDFHYDFGQPIRIDGETEDVVFVFRRRH